MSYPEPSSMSTTDLLDAIGALLARFVVRNEVHIDFQRGGRTPPEHLVWVKSCRAELERRMPANVVWYAGSENIAQTGPYETQADAWKALEVTDAVRVQTRRKHDLGAYVWCEKFPEK